MKTGLLIYFYKFKSIWGFSVQFHVLYIRELLDIAANLWEWQCCDINVINWWEECVLYVTRWPVIVQVFFKQLKIKLCLIISNPSHSISSIEFTMFTFIRCVHLSIFRSVILLINTLHMSAWVVALGVFSVYWFVHGSICLDTFNMLFFCNLHEGIV